MESVDLDILECSVKFIFTDGAPDNPRTWIIRTLKTVVDPSDITAIFKVDVGGAWYTSFTTPDIAEKVVQTDFSSLDTKINVSRADRKTVQLKVLWLPIWIKVGSVESYIEQFGTVLSCSRETESVEGVTFSNGNIKVTLEMAEKDVPSLPYRTVIGGKDCLLTVYGRPPMCLKCREVGHIRRNCPYVKKSNMPSQAVSIPETQGIDISDKSDEQPSVSKLWSDIAPEPEISLPEKEKTVVNSKKRKVTNSAKKEHFELRLVSLKSGKLKAVLGNLDENMKLNYMTSDADLQAMIGKENDKSKHRELILKKLKEKFTNLEVEVDGNYVKGCVPDFE